MCACQHLTPGRLNKINKWCKEWLMQVNISKCKLIQFTKGKKSYSYQYSTTEILIWLISFLRINIWASDLHQTFLGIATSKPSLHAYSSRAIEPLRRNLRCSRSPVRKPAYDTLIKPILEYSASILSPRKVYLTTH